MKRTRRRQVPVVIPSPPQSIRIDAFVRFTVDELRGWKPSQIDALFGGVAKAVSAAQPKPEDPEDGR